MTAERPLFGLSDDHYAAIGRVAARWALLESAIDDHAINVAEVDSEMGACFLAQIIGPGRRLDALISILDRKSASAKTLKAIRRLGGMIVGLGEERNRIVHDPWVAQGVPDEGYYEMALGRWRLPMARKRAPHRLEVTARKKLRSEFVRVETSEVQDLEARIAAATGLLDDIIAEHRKSQRVGSDEVVL